MHKKHYLLPVLCVVGRYYKKGRKKLINLCLIKKKLGKSCNTYFSDAQTSILSA